MRSPDPPTSLKQWLHELLPGMNPCVHAAARCLLQAFFVQFTTNLAQLGRQADRNTGARGARQFFARWLDRSHWEPQQLYAVLPSLLPVLWRGQGDLLLLLDFTHLGGGGEGWTVLQVSVPWQRRALPLYRVVLPRTAPGEAQRTLVLAACDWLALALPGSRRRYVLVMDRGFPSKELVHALRGRGWRFVLRINGDWRITHPEHTGLLSEALKAGRVGTVPQVLRDARFGSERDAKARRGDYQAHVVWYHGPGHAEAWLLATSETDAARAVALYRERMRIEAEFRDLKGALGLDLLRSWRNLNRVARFLAWVAVYEWRLAFLWWSRRLARLAPDFTVHGALSWIRLTREWLAQQVRKKGRRALNFL